MERSLRTNARRLLPDAIRKPLGNVAGYIQHGWLRPIQGWLFDLSGGRFKADGCIFDIPREMTTRTYRSCFWSGEYEEEERELIRKLLRPNDRVLELGACLGIVSCITHRLLAAPAKHVVVEGNPRLIPCIERNRALNQGAFTIENCAVSNQAEVTFYLHPHFIVGGTTQRESNLPVTVRGRSLRELQEQFGPFDVMIMDIEGSELEAFSADEDLLRNYRVVIVELHEWAIGDAGVERCREILQRAGLRKVAEAGRTDAWVRS